MLCLPVHAQFRAQDFRAQFAFTRRLVCKPEINRHLLVPIVASAFAVRHRTDERLSRVLFCDGNLPLSNLWVRYLHAIEPYVSKEQLTDLAAGDVDLHGVLPCDPHELQIYTPAYLFQTGAAWQGDVKDVPPVEETNIMIAVIRKDSPLACVFTLHRDLVHNGLACGRLLRLIADAVNLAHDLDYGVREVKMLAHNDHCVIVEIASDYGTSGLDKWQRGMVNHVLEFTRDYIGACGLLA